MDKEVIHVDLGGLTAYYRQLNPDGIGGDSVRHQPNHVIIGISLQAVRLVLLWRMTSTMW